MASSSRSTANVPLAELPKRDKDRIRAVTMLRALGRKWAVVARELELYQTSARPCEALRRWCTVHRAVAYTEAMALADKELVPELERRARGIISDVFDREQEATRDRLTAVQILLQDRRSADSIREREEARRQNMVTLETARQMRNEAIQLALSVMTQDERHRLLQSIMDDDSGNSTER